MAVKKRGRKYFRVTFTNENEIYQVCARQVSSSEWYGLIEIGDFFFPENTLVINPGEERLKKEFSGISRTWLPYHAILRIDELEDEREGEIKIIPLERKSPPEAPPLLKKPES